MVPQPVEELRAVGLKIYGLKVVVLHEHVVLRTFSHGMLIGTLCPLPRARHGAQRTKVRQRVGVTDRFGKDVCTVGVRCHGSVPEQSAAFGLAGGTRKAS